MVTPDRKSTRLNSSPANISALSLHDALPIYPEVERGDVDDGDHAHRDLAGLTGPGGGGFVVGAAAARTRRERGGEHGCHEGDASARTVKTKSRRHGHSRSEEHTSELQSRQYLRSFPTRRSSDLSRGRAGRRR